jgi:hypothetical protein
VKLFRGHRHSLAVVEVRHVKPEGSIVHYLNNLLHDHSHILGLTIGGEPHQLIFTRVHLKAGVISERGVKHSQGMGKPHLVVHRDVISFALPDRTGCPFTHCIQRQNCCLFERRWKKGAGRVRLMMADKAYLPAKFTSEFSQDSLREAQFKLSPRRHGTTERLKPKRCISQRRLQDAFELHKRSFIKDNIIEVRDTKTCLRAAIPDRIARKAWIMLASCKSLLLGCGYNLPVLDQCGRRVMVKGCYAKNVGCHIILPDH